MCFSKSFFKDWKDKYQSHEQMTAQYESLHLNDAWRLLIPMYLMKIYNKVCINL